MRGGHISVTKEELVSRAEKLAKNGTRELLLIAQDLTYYGLDIYKKRELADLLKRISDVKGIEWIRLHYAFPSGFPMEVLDVMNERENICKYLDMPLQHISNRILQSMKRGITKEKTIGIVNEIRSRVPKIALRTTLIAGYPGETTEEHEEMLQWVKDTRFDRLGIFSYSHEENTGAYKLEDTVSEVEKQERVSAIMEIQQEISHSLNQAKKNKIFKVLIDRKEGGYYIGRTEFDSPDVDNEVLIKADKELYLRIGDFVQVKIKSAEEFDLFGEVISS
jgi:ribosomal protein S12 methylthiotransferase